MLEAGDFTVSSLSGTLNYSNGYGSASINLAKTGYKAIGIVGFSISSTYFAPSIVSFDYSGQKANLTIRHVNDGTVSGNVTVYVMVLYIKTS